MNKVIKLNRRPGRRATARAGNSNRPTRTEAEDAVRTLIRWAGDDPDREGLRATPARAVRAYEEWFGGYDEDPRDYKVSFDKIREQLGFETLMTVPDGIGEVIAALDAGEFADPFDGKYRNIP